MGFIDVLPANHRVYRSKNGTLQSGGTWFTLHPEDSYGYGTHTYEYIASRDIRLINVLSDEFYNDYMLKLHMKYDDLHIDEKIKRLYPLGIKNIQLYMKLTSRLGLKPPHSIHQNFINPVYDDLMEYNLLFVNNRSRNSILQLDTMLYESMREFYGSICDGFYWSVRTPNIVYNSYHHAEVAAFDPSLFVNNGTITRPTSGGAIPVNTNIYQPVTVSDEQIDYAFGFLKSTAPPRMAPVAVPVSDEQIDYAFGFLKSTAPPRMAPVAVPVSDEQIDYAFGFLKPPPAPAPVQRKQNSPPNNANTKKKRR